ncbi:MAG TPA: pyruvate, phosphate dikinase [Bacillota bacterium]|jgi:pyruvate,orthophosphate dikinase
MSGVQYVFPFAEGRACQRDLLGGKGANLAEMTHIGLPVPPGFTISTEACKAFYAEGEKLPEGLWPAALAELDRLEKKTGKKLGDTHTPLLVSVRSGAKFSMPGMMDTILNLGLNDQTVLAVARATNDERFAYDCYRRFIQMFSNVVLKVDIHDFERLLEGHKEDQRVRFDHEISPDSLRSIVHEYKEVVKREAGRDFPQDPVVQLEMAVVAVFASWHNQRAIVYRKQNNIPADLGTAVNVQTMVFGNMGFDSGTGVIFTRNPATGDKGLYGEYLTNAQGEDVVAGIRTPKPIAELDKDLPAVYKQLVGVCGLLEQHYADMQDIEFTVEHGVLYLLQTRTGKRTAAAAVKIAADLVHEGKIGKREAIMRIEPDQLTKLLHRGIDPKAKLKVIAQGLPASPGAASGQVVFDADEAQARGEKGQKVLLVRPETTPDDIHGIIAAQGILTSRGGMTCHAAIVARHMGKPCVVGCDALKISVERKEVLVDGAAIHEGDLVSIDGATGQVILGEVPLVDPELSGEFEEILGWCDELKKLGVWANADTPGDAKKARDFGAKGIGLCRTEHMFMAHERIPVVQEMIVALNEKDRRAALDKLLPMQQGDFYGILKAMEGFPVTIRLLDPPLHEFLPDGEELAVDIARLRALASKGETGHDAEIAEKEELLKKVRALAEFNPMMGFRGCRLGVVHPEIYEMQCRAIFQAAAQLVKEGVDARPEVMIPLVGHIKELQLLRGMTERVLDEVQKATGVTLKQIMIGTMIEVPRAALTADEIATEAEFFSFGTNDLTQMTFGFSRDDAEAKFLPIYTQKGILPGNPFATLDEGGVGKLVEMAVRLGRGTRPGLQIGICGEHGGDPQSIGFCHRVGLDYVSCSPFRVPIARLAAAQANVAQKIAVEKDK